MTCASASAWRPLTEEAARAEGASRGLGRPAAPWALRGAATWLGRLSCSPRPQTCGPGCQAGYPRVRIGGPEDGSLSVLPDGPGQECSGGGRPPSEFPSGLSVPVQMRKQLHLGRAAQAAWRGPGPGRTWPGGIPGSQPAGSEAGVWDASRRAGQGCGLGAESALSWAAKFPGRSRHGGKCSLFAGGARTDTPSPKPAKCSGLRGWTFRRNWACSIHFPGGKNMGLDVRTWAFRGPGEEKKEKERITRRRLGRRWQNVTVRGETRDGEQGQPCRPRD